MTEEKGWNKLTVPQLKAELARRGVTETSWKKADLVDRLTEVCKAEALEDTDSVENDILVIDEWYDDKKETGIAMNGKETMTEPVAKEAKNGEPKRIHYRIKKIDNNAFDRVVSEAEVLTHVTIFPITLSDLERPDIRECLNRCSSFNMNFVNESSTGTSWHGLLQMEFKTVQDAFNAKDTLHKIGLHFTILHRPSKSTMEKTVTTFTDKKQAILKPQIEQLLHVENLPTNVSESNIQEEFPQANLVIIPIIDGKKTSQAYVNFPDIDTMVKATTEKNQVLQFGEKSCDVSVVRLKGRSLSRELWNALFGGKLNHTHKPAQKKKKVRISKVVGAVNTKLQRAEVKYKAMKNKHCTRALKLKKQIDDLSHKLQTVQTAGQDKYGEAQARKGRTNDKNYRQSRYGSQLDEQDTRSNYEILDMDRDSYSYGMDFDAVTLKHQSQLGDDRMGSPRDSYQQQLGVYGSGDGSRGIANSRSFPRSISSSTDVQVDSRMCHGGFGNKDGQQVGSSLQRSGVGQIYHDGNTRNYGGYERPAAEDDGKQNEGGSKTVNILMQLKNIFGTHLERQERQMQDIRGQIKKVAVPHGPVVEKRSHTSRQTDNEIHNEQDDEDCEPYGKISKVDDNSVRSGYNHQDSGFNQQDNGYNLQDSGFNLQDSGFNLQESGFHQQDSGFNQQQLGFCQQDCSGHQDQQDKNFQLHYGDFNQKDHGLKQQGHSFVQHYRGFSQAHHGFNQQDCSFVQHDRGFSLARGFNQQGYGLKQMDHCPDKKDCRARQQYRAFNPQDCPFRNDLLRQINRHCTPHEHGYDTQEGGYTSQEGGYSLQEASLSQHESGFTSRDDDFDRRGFTSQGFGSSDTDMRTSTGIGESNVS